MQGPQGQAQGSEFRRWSQRAERRRWWRRRSCPGTRIPPQGKHCCFIFIFIVLLFYDMLSQRLTLVMEEFTLIYCVPCFAFCLYINSRYLFQSSHHSPPLRLSLRQVRPAVAKWFPCRVTVKMRKKGKKARKKKRMRRVRLRTSRKVCFFTLLWSVFWFVIIACSWCVNLHCNTSFRRRLVLSLSLHTFFLLQSLLSAQQQTTTICLIPMRRKRSPSVCWMMVRTGPADRLRAGPAAEARVARRCVCHVDVFGLVSVRWTVVWCWPSCGLMFSQAPFIKYAS